MSSISCVRYLILCPLCHEYLIVLVASIRGVIGIIASLIRRKLKQRLEQTRIKTGPPSSKDKVDQNRDTYIAPIKVAVTYRLAHVSCNFSFHEVEENYKKKFLKAHINNDEKYMKKWGQKFSKSIHHKLKASTKNYRNFHTIFFFT